MIPTRKRRKERFTKIITLGHLRPVNPENSYEIPLLEFIVRKGWGKQNKPNIGRFNPVIRRRDYKPSSSYIRFIAKYHPLHKTS